MRFARLPRTTYVVTDRKRAAAARAQRRQREAFPLLADIIAETQPPIDAVMTERLARWGEHEVARRAQQAANWRRARQAIDALPPPTRTAVLHYWNTHRWMPATPVYLLDTLHALRCGRLAVAGGTLAPTRPVIAPSEALAAFGPVKPRARGWLQPVRHP
jgi:hypothetical protein